MSIMLINLSYITLGRRMIFFLGREREDGRGGGEGGREGEGGQRGTGRVG